ncbi:MAG: VWA domain-containing protein [Vicinamibacterales bacterium]
MTTRTGPTHKTVRLATFGLVALGVALPLTPLRGQQGADGQGRFKAGVELVNVTATVSDRNGRFVPGLTADDFVVYEDDARQTVSQFNAERVPVSLGIALDTSGSMMGEKIEAARAALNRFLFDLLDRDDETFLYQFSDAPFLLQDWTIDRQGIGRQLGRIQPHGGTAIYDTLMDALPLTTGGRHAKKALLLISDGNDTSSAATVSDVKARLRQTEVLLYAIGIDGDDERMPRAPLRPPQPRRPPLPRSPFPPGPPRPWFPQASPQFRPSSQWPQGNDQHVNATALRELTDDSGGRTEIVRGPMDLAPATASIADELSKQYYLGYTSTNGAHDGRWRSIHVELRDPAYRVRARRGYIAN